MRPLIVFLLGMALITSCSTPRPVSEVYYEPKAKDGQWTEVAKATPCPPGVDSAVYNQTVTAYHELIDAMIRIAESDTIQAADSAVIAKVIQRPYKVRVTDTVEVLRTDTVTVTRTQTVTVPSRHDVVIVGLGALSLLLLLLLIAQYIQNKVNARP